MSKVDTREWKEFKVGDIFYLNIAKSKDFGKLFEGSTPFVGRTSFNNGIQGYVKGLPCEDKDCITISMVGENKAFWQTKSFLASQNILILRKEELSKYNAFFICGILNKFILKNYNYKTTIKLSTFSNEIIKLPIDREGNPDRAYMEVYMKNIEEKCKQSLEKLQGVRNTMNHKIDTVDWEEFKIGDLFEISSPSPRSQNNYEDGKTPFVASGDVNNGILKYCTPKQNEQLDHGNCITVSPVDGNSFYQKENFLGRGGAGSSIMILRNNHLNQYCGLFIAGIIRKCSNFTYNDMGNREKLKNLIIKLPVDHEGNPNRAYMESYMQNLMEKNQKKLQSLH